MSVVLDGSIALAWCFKDERTAFTERLLNKVARDGALVPGIWHLEVLNGLRTGIKRGRMTQLDRDENLKDLLRLRIATDNETNYHAWSATLRLSDKYGLTPYDASYLELAQRIRLPLATLDQAMQRAAIEAQIELYPL